MPALCETLLLLSWVYGHRSNTDIPNGRNLSPSPISWQSLDDNAIVFVSKSCAVLFTPFHFVMYTWPKSISLTGRRLDICHLFVCRIVSPLLNIFSSTFLIWHYFLHRYSGLCMCLGIVFPFDLLAKHRGFVILLLSSLTQVLACFSNSSYSSFRSVFF